MATADGHHYCAYANAECSSGLSWADGSPDQGCTPVGNDDGGIHLADGGNSDAPDSGQHPDAGPTPDTGVQDFDAGQLVTVSVVKAGMGQGAVTSSTGNIQCGATCSESVVSGTSITLSANASTNYVFVGWSGGGCSGTQPCTIAPTATADVTATFQDFLIVSVQYNYRDAMAGGTISTSPSGITCTVAVGFCTFTNPCVTRCSGSFVRGSTVTVTASPVDGAMFAGWDTVNPSACGANPSDAPGVKVTKLYTNPCTFVVGLDTQNIADSVKFGSPVAVNTLLAQVQFGDNVTSTPPGLNCPSASCTTIFANGGAILLTASGPATWTPDPSNSSLSSCPQGPTCITRSVFGGTSSAQTMKVGFVH